MSFVRRYWIAGLVLCLVVTHAVIIGYVRSEAAKIKVMASNEIPLGVYFVQAEDRRWVSQLRIHLLVQPAKRLSAKATIEHNRWLLHEAVEEKLHTLDPDLLKDPVLLEIKEKIKLTVEEQLADSIVEAVLINDRIDLPIETFRYKPAYDPTTPEPIFTSTQASPELEEIDND